MQARIAEMGEPAKYQFTEAEKALMREYLVPVTTSEVAAVNLTVSTDGQQSIDAKHPEPQFGWLVVMKALGTTDPETMKVLVANLAALSKPDGKTVLEQELNANLALVRGIAPTNPTEAMLAVQMAAVHGAAIKQARLLQKASTDVEMDLHARSLNKLARTFTMQAEALKKLRNSGEQKVTVEHRHYHLHQVPADDGGGVEEKTEQLPHGREPGLRFPEREAVLGALEADQVPVSSASDERVVSLPVSRGTRRSAGRAGA